MDLSQMYQQETIAKPVFLDVFIGLAPPHRTCWLQHYSNSAEWVLVETVTSPSITSGHYTAQWHGESCNLTTFELSCSASHSQNTLVPAGWAGELILMSLSLKCAAQRPIGPNYAPAAADLEHNAANWQNTWEVLWTFACTCAFVYPRQSDDEDAGQFGRCTSDPKQEGFFMIVAIKPLGAKQYFCFTAFLFSPTLVHKQGIGIKDVLKKKKKNTTMK